MEPAPASQRQPSPAQAWEIVRRLPRLTGEPKLAWLFLWQQAGMRPGRVIIHPASVGEDQGAAQADRSGRRSLLTLEDRGLIQIIETAEARARRGGCWTIYVEDPVAIEQARLVRADPQGELFPDEAPVPPTNPEPVDVVRFPDPAEGPAPAQTAAVVQHPPSARSKEEVKVITDARTEVKVEGSYLANGGSCAAPAVCATLTVRKEKPPDVPRPLSGDVAAAMDRMTDGVLKSRELAPEEARRLVSYLEVRVNDNTMLRSVYDRVAWAVVEGRYPRRKLEDILDRIRRDFGHRSAKDRGMYFVGAIKRSFAAEGIEFTEKKATAAGVQQTP